MNRTACITHHAYTNMHRIQWNQQLWKYCSLKIFIHQEFCKTLFIRKVIH